MRKLILMAMMMAIFSVNAQSGEAVQAYVPDAQEVGEARLTYLFWDVYDATLHAPKGEWNHAQPFALSLRYLRSLEGEKIADRSAEEMRKQGYNDEIKLAAWYAQMRDIFPDVKKGDEITGIYYPDAPAEFLLNGKPLGEVKDPEFGSHFFDIWLSEKTTEPEMRRALLGLK